MNNFKRCILTYGYASKLSSRTMSSKDIDYTIAKPGAVRINVQGAFIVDSEPGSPNHSSDDASRSEESSAQHETHDIRLPNHTGMVSHIAIDVGYFRTLCFLAVLSFLSLRAFFYVVLSVFLICIVFYVLIPSRLVDRWPRSSTSPKNQIMRRKRQRKQGVD